ncbi:cyclopropane mycolic acid synthase family methyltransferase [Mycolicibacterium sp. 050158]|jgi:cyclopropane-fatty-acyl-phospholipid synthase|uniref:cyclopropane mycolic acid synthase family methyltransferase n=1 Tax=Mycolicibacterium sp. 050158 TaxID=3090602 RepID=UPI00299F5084|nr:cyclopropane mycolic acid synthase family methyltransferase [Mycolicibacterium sp. 050158]MDX1888134.1 cyclopropane mycolic acid synthase family methyltransferase [Mycolicibacterium sp. 050158]
MAESTVDTKAMEPHFEEVQAHYDLSDDFFGTFQDPSRTYSCAYFERDDMTLEEAQVAKIDLALGKLDLRPGMTLLDIGCGWGSVLKRAVEEHDVNVVGLTLSKNQNAYAQALLDDLDTERTRRVLLRGWEQFDEPVDRIISLEAIEAFPQERYAPFFKRCSSILPDDGRMVLQAILGHPLKKWPELGIPVTMTDLRFMRFIAKEIFPGGSVPGDEQIVALATESGFTVEQKQLLDEHYVRTLDMWAAALEEHHDEAVAATSEEVYQRYMKYLTGCSDFFKRRVSELGQYTLVRS